MAKTKCSDMGLKLVLIECPTEWDEMKNQTQNAPGSLFILQYYNKGLSFVK